MSGFGKLKIGNVELENNIILGPMAGVSDLPFRLLCHEQGAGLVCMEMVSAKAITYKNKNTDKLMALFAMQDYSPIRLSFATNVLFPRSANPPFLPSEQSLVR